MIPDGNAPGIHGFAWRALKQCVADIVIAGDVMDRHGQRRRDPLVRSRRLRIKRTRARHRMNQIAQMNDKVDIALVRAGIHRKGRVAAIIVGIDMGIRNDRKGKFRSPRSVSIL